MNLLLGCYVLVWGGNVVFYHWMLSLRWVQWWFTDKALRRMRWALYLSSAVLVFAAVWYLVSLWLIGSGRVWS